MYSKLLGLSTLTVRPFLLSLGLACVALIFVVGCDNDDDDVITVSQEAKIFCPTPVVTENGEPGFFQISLTEAPEEELRVYYSASGTASQGTDYATLTNSLSFAPGETSKTVAIVPIDDAEIEPTEEVIVTLQHPSGARYYTGGANSTSTMSIRDNDLPTATIEIQGAGRLSEPGIESANVVFRFDRPSHEDIIIDYGLSGTASSEDFIATGSSIIPAGAMEAVITVSVVDDDLIESDETLLFTILPANDYVLGEPKSTSITLTSDEVPSAVVSASDAQAAEPADDGEYTITLSQAVDSDVSVSFSLDGTAVTDLDFTIPASPAVIPAGQTSVTLTLAVIDDVTIEADETATLTLTASGTGYSLGADVSADITLASDDIPQASVVATDAAAAEAGLDTGTFTVLLSEAYHDAITIAYSVEATAVSASDYQPLSGTLSIAAGDTSGPITLTPIDDVYFESDETVSVSLVPGVNYSIGAPSTATITITSDDDSNAEPNISFVSLPAGTFTMGSPDAEDGHQADESTTHSVTLSKDFEVSTAEITIDQFRAFLLEGGDKTGVDFLSATCPINDDATFSLTGNAFSYAGSQPMTEISWQAASDFCDWLTVSEVAAGRLSVNRLFRLPTEAEWEYACRAGTTTRFSFGDDASLIDIYNFVWFSGNSTATNLVKQKPANPWALYDIHGNVSEWCRDYYGAYSASSVTDPTGPVTGTNRVVRGGSWNSSGIDCRSARRQSVDPSSTTNAIGFRIVGVPVIATVLATDPNAAEAGPDNGQFTISLSETPVSDVTINYTLGGVAGNGTDYTTLNGTAVVSAGTTSVAVTIIPIDDAIIEPDEAVSLTLAAGTGYSIGMADSDTVTIVSNDVPSVTISAITPSAAEPGTNGEFQFTLSEAYHADITVLFSLSGSAALGADFSFGGTSIVSAGATSAVLIIDVLDDAIIEAVESVEVTIAAGTNYTVGDPSLATVTITSDDYPEASLVASDITAKEAGSKSGEFTITVSEVYHTDLTFNVVASGSATPDTDYTALPSTVLLTAGNPSVSFSVTPIDDAVEEGFETVIATLVGGTEYTVNASQNTGTVTIHDDERDRDIPDLGIILKSIPAGTFIMGSPETELGRSTNEGPQHPVIITNDYWMTQSEITVNQFRIFLLDGGDPYGVQFTDPDCPLVDNASFDLAGNGYSLSGDQPMVEINYTAAKNFCSWLTARESVNIPVGYEYRLPTEAEWEYACRAGTTTNFSYGQDPAYSSLSTVAWFNFNGGSYTQPVMQKNPNPWGLYDIHGNVWEWCSDWLSAGYGSEAVDRDPTGSESGTRRILRSGGYGNAGYQCRSAHRGFRKPGDTDAHMGFRMVLAPKLGPNGIDRPIDDLGIVMKPIPAGTFAMGTPDTEVDRDADEGSQHTVIISTDFYMAETEITQAQYLAIAASNPSDFTGDLSRPVERVSWSDAIAFCEALTTREASNIPTGYEYRLPTEAEWEYACRAGTTTRFNYGDDIGYGQFPNYGWSSPTYTTTKPVAGKLPNPWLLYDMHGNVYEWCNDYYADSYSADDATDPIGPASGTTAIIRSGCYNNSSRRSCRSGERWYADKTTKHHAIGFRIVLAPKVGTVGVDRPLTDLGIIMKPIPAGEFSMGSPDTEAYRDGNEGPQHRSIISQDFWIGETEITQAQYEAISGSNPSSYAGVSDRPVEMVSWNDAVAFCEALTASKASSIPSGYEYRLPTSAEWEYACRAGSTTAFYYGDDTSGDAGNTFTDLGNYAWYSANASKPKPVAQKIPNDWGLYDMHGNVWEWCRDWNQPYSLSSLDGMVIHYTYDGNADDSSESANHGTVSGAILAADRFGVADRAYQFDGANDVIDSSAALPDMTTLTFASWIYLDVLDGTRRFVFMEGDSSPGRDLILWLQSGDQSRFMTKDNDGLFIPDSLIPVGEWFHIAAVCDSENDNKSVWINGAKVVEDAAWAGTANVGFHSVLRVGGSLSSYMAGKLDDVRFYTRALPESDIRELFLNQSNTDPSGPLAGTQKVHRGGRFGAGGRYCRSANYNAIEPTHSSQYIGFRIVLGPKVKLAIDDLGMTLLPIPAGTFTMGSPDTEPYRSTNPSFQEGPQHSVTITRDFWMGRTEVTQAQYEAIMGNNPSYIPGNDNGPVTGVSWSDSVTFCQTLTSRESASLPNGYEYRLPTEAEWEYACRAGTTTAFSYGDDSSSDGVSYGLLGKHAWYKANSTSPRSVAQKIANPWGLCDMQGNVFEWCHDWLGDYTSEDQTDPVGPSTGMNWILRGGSWFADGKYCRSAARSAAPGGTGSHFGFRIVLAPALP